MKTMKDFLEAEAAKGEGIRLTLISGREWTGVIEECMDEVFLLRLADGRSKVFSYAGIVEYEPVALLQEGAGSESLLQSGTRPESPPLAGTGTALPPAADAGLAVMAPIAGTVAQPVVGSSAAPFSESAIDPCTASSAELRTASTPELHTEPRTASSPVFHTEPRTASTPEHRTESHADSVEKPSNPAPAADSAPKPAPASSGMDPDFDEVHVGTITAIKKEKSYGFIDGRLFFHRNFVLATETELIRLLSEGKGSGRRVHYRLGRNETSSDKRPCARHVWLAPREELPPEEPLPDSSSLRFQISESMRPLKQEDLHTQPTANAWSFAPDSRSDTPGWYNRARNAQAERRYETALTLFQSAIDHADKPESAIGDMVSLYLKLNETEQAEKLLHQHAGLLAEEVRDRLLETIYNKSKDFTRHLAILDRVIASSDRLETKLNYLWRKAKLLSDAENRDRDALDALKECDRVKNDIKKLLNLQGMDAAGKYARLDATVMRRKARCHANLNETEEAKTLAKALLRMDENDELALAILGDRMDAYEPERVIVLEEETVTGEITGELSDYLIFRMNQFDLVSVLDIRKVHAGRYSGSLKEARDDVDRLDSASTQEPRKRSTWSLAAAKIIHQFLLDEEGAEISSVDLSQEDRTQQLLVAGFTKKLRNQFLAKSLVSDGDYSLLTQSVPLDAARYRYEEGVRFLGKGAQDKYNAVVRHVSSFFLDRQEIPVSMHGSRNLSILKDLDACFDKTEAVDFNAFMNACLALFVQDAEVRRQLQKVLHGNPWTKVETVKWLRQRLAETASADASSSAASADTSAPTGTTDNSPPIADISPETLTLPDYMSLWDRAVEQHLELEKQWMSFMKQLSRFSFQPLWLAATREELEQQTFPSRMSELDRFRVSAMSTLLEQADRFNKADDFEQRENALTGILDTCSGLNREIAEHPTRYAFEVLLDLLPSIGDAARVLLDKLYMDARPELSVTLVDRHVTVPEGRDVVLLQLSVCNEKSRQAADDLTLIFPDSDRCEPTRDLAFRRGYLKGGETETLLVDMRLSEAVLQERAFSLHVLIRYSYKVPGDREVREEAASFSVDLIDGQSQPLLDNPYSTYSQSGEVTDPHMFFGREQILDNFSALIRKPDGELLRKKSIVFYGQKRTGKSSILYHLQNRIRETSPQTVVVDIGNIAQLFNVMDTEEVMRAVQFQLLSRMRDAIEDDHPELLSLLDESGISIPAEQMLTPGSPSSVLFSDFFTRFNRCVGERHNVVVLIDEFSYLYAWMQEGKLSRDFMKFWKAVVQSCGIVGILVGQDYMPEFIRAFPNEFGSTQVEKITYLSEEAAVRLMTEPIPLVIDGKPESRYREGAIARMLELTAGSAYYTMFLCARLVECLNEERQVFVTDAYLDKLVETRLLRGNAMLNETMFDPLYNDEGDVSDPDRKTDNLLVLRRIAELSRKTGMCAFEELAGGAASTGLRLEMESPGVPGLSCGRVLRLLESLENRDVLERVDGRNLRIRVGLFREWLLSRYGGMA